MRFVASIYNSDNGLTQAINKLDENNIHEENIGIMRNTDMESDNPVASHDILLSSPSSLTASSNAIAKSTVVEPISLGSFFGDFKIGDEEMEFYRQTIEDGGSVIFVKSSDKSLASIAEMLERTPAVRVDIIES